MLIRSRRTGKDRVVSQEDWEKMVKSQVSISFIILKNDADPTEVPEKVRDFLNEKSLLKRDEKPKK